MVENYYKILEVDPNASTEEEIRKSYRRLAKRFHPDKNPSSEKEAAEAKFKKLNEAYQVLIDPKKRKKYDDSLTINKVRPPPVVETTTTPSSSSCPNKNNPPPRRNHNNNNHHSNPSPSVVDHVYGDGERSTTARAAQIANMLYYGSTRNNQSAGKKRIRRRRSTFRWNPFRMLMACFNKKN